ncbi:hypothetical protein PHPALM_27603 [Phytophthora palmivora]|uniref:Uncharacterized protein n=1 Tax=Phytophthora palmivora TaxID=4796 RepID=A0A2P4XC58_9STRA|nr:hypothetical protein PHPALM_27603 [Phytophthora palmivora]
MNSVVGLEQGYGGGIWTTAPPTTEVPVTTAPPTTTESSSDSTIDTTGSQVEGSSAIDEGSDAYPDTNPSPDSSYGNSLSWDGSDINGDTGSFSGGKITSDDGSSDYVEVPSGSEETNSSSSTIDMSSPSDVGSDSAEVPPGKGGDYPTSSVSGSDRDNSAGNDDSSEVSGSEDDQPPHNGGCQVRTRRLR